MPDLTIRHTGALLSVTRREITAAQERLIDKVLRVTDITLDAERIEYDMDLALQELGEEAATLATHDAVDAMKEDA